jgi:glycosyltransferase involved in cell wall biosynthesis
MAKEVSSSRSALRPPAPSGVEKPRNDSSRRILVASHSHPQLTKGGAEIAAYELFAALRYRPEYKLWFLGCVRDQIAHKLGATISQPFSEQEYLYACGRFDWFKFSNADSNFPRAFRALLEALDPQIVHFHHYLNFGVETFLHIRATLPNCRIVLTLHEYLAICHHFGQMVTKQHLTLCYQAAPIRCSGCFKEITPSDFFLRKMYIRRFFDLVDHFIAPSNFLAERYVAWGVPTEKISVIENIIPGMADKSGAELIGDPDGPLRVGFFGQISVLKGIGLLLDAAELLEKRNEYGVVFEIFGDYSGQPAEFQADFLARLGKAGRNVIFHGPYDQNRVDQLMQAVDLVLTPSIWWENSPVVIQEALRNRRPIVCSDIGGMAEKVRDGLDGFHFPAGNSIALASLLHKLAGTPARLIGIAETMKAPDAAIENIARHERLYASLLS